MMVSASPVRWSMKSWGRMATDSSHIEKAQRIYGKYSRSGYAVHENNVEDVLTSAGWYL